MHNWVTEGTADWVMADIDPKGEAALAGYWDQYAKYPSTAYTDRSYDAIGVFGHLSDLLGDQAVIPRLLPVVTRAVGGDDDDAFGYLIQGNETEYLNSWGSSYELTGGRKLWSMTGPGHPPDSGGAVQSVTINAGDKETYVYNPWNAHVVKVVGNADIVSAALLVGYGRLHDDGYGIDTVDGHERTAEALRQVRGMQVPGRLGRRLSRDEASEGTDRARHRERRKLIADLSGRHLARRFLQGAG